MTCSHDPKDEKLAVWEKYTTGDFFNASLHFVYKNGLMQVLSVKLLTQWRHQMETFSVLLALCAGNSPVTGKFPTQKPVTRSFDVFFDLRLNKQLSKQSWGWFETPSRSLWRHCNDHEWIQSIWLQSTHTRTYASDTNYSCSWRLTHMCGSEQVHLCFLKWLLYCRVISHYLNQYWHVTSCQSGITVTS